MIAADIQYAEAGAGKPVICLHGIGGGVASFQDQLSGLTQGLGISKEMKPLRVISWAMPGYGDSAPGTWPPSFATLSDRLADFIEDLGLKRVHLVGQSIGGMIALDHALRRPDQVATLSLIGTTPAFGGRDDSFKDAFLKARLAPLEAGLSMAQMAKKAAPAIVGPDAAAEVITAVQTPMAAVRQETWRGILQCLVTFNRRDDLGAVTQPCCLIAGGHDQNAPARTMEKMAAKLPNAEYHLINSAGHMINQEAPCETNAILHDFLTRHPL